MIVPIKPEDVTNKKLEILPEQVIEAFNESIIENYDPNTRSARVIQDEIVKKIISKLEIERHIVFEKGYLDIEDIYRKAGWKVEYDKPGYNETYKAYFVFTKDK